MEDFIMYLAVILIFVLFVGEPDIHDKLIASFDEPSQNKDCEQSKVVFKEKILYVDKQDKWD